MFSLDRPGSHLSNVRQHCVHNNNRNDDGEGYKHNTPVIIILLTNNIVLDYIELFKITLSDIK